MQNLSLDNDGEYFSRVILCATSIKFIPKSRSYCRRWTKGISQNITIDDHKLDSLSFSLFLYVERLIGMEDSPRTRDACLKLLNRWSIYFYPERKDIFLKLKSLAKDLGGDLPYPKLQAKYWWLKSIFGLRIAKKFQRTIPYYRTYAERCWEHFLFGRK